MVKINIKDTTTECFVLGMMREDGIIVIEVKEGKNLICLCMYIVMCGYDKCMITLCSMFIVI